MARFILPIIAVFYLIHTSQTYAAGYYGSGSYADIAAGIRYDDNVSRAQNDSDIKDDFIADLVARYSIQTNINSRN